MMKRKCNVKNYCFALGTHIAKREAYNKMVQASQFNRYKILNAYAWVVCII